MAARSLQVVGENHLEADLRGMARAALDLTAPLGRESRRAAEDITGVARRTGELAAAVKDPKNRRVTGDGFDIGAGTFYGHMVFRGTSHSRAQPPTIPAKSIARRSARVLGGHIVRHRHGVSL